MGDFPWIDTSLDVTWALLGLGAGATERAIDALAGAVRGAGGPNARQLAFQLVSLALHGVNGGPLQHESASLTERQRSALRAVLDTDAMWAAGPSVGCSPDGGDLVAVLARRSRRRAARRPRFLLHGDCGVHNFLFRDGRLAAVIDPSPALGDPCFDVLHAACGWPDEYTPGALAALVARLPNVKAPRLRSLVEDAAVVLYWQTAACQRYHPAHIEP
ncbi:MAG TPA: phosphotransferase [Chloroflexota bacterium]|jgi:hypothetical protein|nr:phosphotransferase [Chloroflexota bacterium]